MLQANNIPLIDISDTARTYDENYFVIKSFKKQKGKMQKMSPTNGFLLIGFRPGDEWHNFLDEALSVWGKLDMVQEEEALKAISRNKYNLLIVDAGAVHDVARLVSELRAQQPEPILVVTASPTWQAAREVLKAGAVDYIGRSFDKKKLRSHIKDTLKIVSSLSM